MLAYNIIKDIMQFSHRLSEKYNFTLISSMTTNGSLLTLKKLYELNELGVNRFQISFDGNQDLHDKLRITRVGNGSFKIIYRNLVNLHNSNLRSSIIIRLHLNKNNYEGISKFIDKLSEDFAYDDRFLLFIRGLSKLGGKNDNDLPVIENPEIVKNMITTLTLKARKLHLTLYRDACIMCYDASFSEYVIRSDGSIQKCTVALYDDKNTIWKINEDGTVNINTDKLTYWVRGQLSGNPAQLKCPLRSKN